MCVHRSVLLYPVREILMIRNSLAMLLAVGLAASGAAAQEAAEVRPGARVRVSAPQFYQGQMLTHSMRPEIGTLVSVDSASVTVRIQRDGTLMTTPFSAIRRFEVSRGTHSALQGSLRGMRKGALIGAGLVASGYAIAYLVLIGGDKLQGANCSFELLTCGEPEDPSIEYFIPALTVATVGGALLGVTVGSAERERWDGVRVRTLPRTEVTLSISLQ